MLVALLVLVVAASLLYIVKNIMLIHPINRGMLFIVFTMLTIGLVFTGKAIFFLGLLVSYLVSLSILVYFTRKGK